MHTRNLVSSIALVAALSFSTGAMAQATVMRGVEIPPDDLPEVQSLCNTLLAQANESLTANGDDEGDDADGDTSDDADGDNGDDADGADGDNGDDTDMQDPASEDESEPSDLDQAVTTIDLDTITLEDCKAAGLVDTEKVVVE